MRNKLIAALLVVVILAGGGWWYAKRKANAAASNKDKIVEVAARKGDISVSISGTGPVASINGVSVKSNQQGTVSQLLVSEGDKVKAGQVIMLLDNKNLVASLNQAQIDLQSSRDALDNLLHPLDTTVRSQQLKVQAAQFTLQQRQTDVNNLTVAAPASGVIATMNTTQGSNVTANQLLFTIYDDSTPTFVVGLPQDAAAAVRVGARVKVSLTAFGDVWGIVQTSGGAATPGTGNRDATVPVVIELAPAYGVRPGMVGSVTFDGTSLLTPRPYVVQGNGSIRNDVTEVRAQVAGTVSQLGLDNNGGPMREGTRVNSGYVLAVLSNDGVVNALETARNDLVTQQQNLTDLLDPSKDGSDSLRVAKQKVDQATVTLASRQSDVDDLQVKAPVAGQISSLTPRVGDRVTSGQALFRVADYGGMQVTISVDELDIAKVKLGQKANVTLDALPGKTYTGKVIKINPEGVFKNDIANFDVTVQFDKPDGLMAGMNATVSVVVTDRPGVVWVPAQAVSVRQGKAYVRINDNGAPVDKEIQIGIRTDTQVEVTGGLNEGDKIILTIVKASSTSGRTGGMFGGGMFGGGGNNRPATPSQGGNAPAGGYPGGNGGGGGNYRPSGGGGGGQRGG